MMTDIPFLIPCSKSLDSRHDPEFLHASLELLKLLPKIRVSRDEWRETEKLCLLGVIL